MKKKEEKTKVWGSEIPELGRTYVFPKPVKAKSIRFKKKTTDKGSGMKERRFVRGRLVEIFKDEFVFRGKKRYVSTTNRLVEKTSKSIYTFYIPKR